MRPPAGGTYKKGLPANWEALLSLYIVHCTLYKFNHLKLPLGIKMLQLVGDGAQEGGTQCPVNDAVVVRQ